MKTLVSVFLVLIVTAVLGWFFIPKPSLHSKASYSNAIYSEQHQLLRLTLNSKDQYRLYTPLNQISPLLIKATLLQEDKYFYEHHGVNPIALLRAFFSTYILRERRVGASTITMQLAKLQYQINSSTILGKLQQIYYAIALEKYYSKKQILQAYFNLLPYGGNIEGIDAASLIYFHTEPKNLTLTQALTLTVIPQNPNKRSPLFKNNDKNLLIARNQLLQLWKEKYSINKDQLIRFNLPLETYSRAELPDKAPHFVDFILQQKLKRHTVDSTLSLRLQMLSQKVLSNYLHQHKNLGIKNAAVLLVDTNTMAIKAMVGSANFYNAEIEGQVNGTLAKRSPGSTLKPFIYALAIEQGLINPKTKLNDMPMQFHDYNPENIDSQFMGPITAEEALNSSRNIPAIFLESKLGQNNLYSLLTKANVKNLKSEQYYGLSLALGSGDLSMSELVALYSSLINKGIYYPLRYQASQQLTQGIRLLSPEASFITLDMLAKKPALNLIRSSAWINTLPTVAWKTGTSSAYRDAWSIGLFSHYALAVWIGEFKPKTNLAVTGARVAAPLMFQLIHGINQELGPLTNFSLKPQGLNIKEIAVCKASGLLPTKLCPKTVLTWFIPGVSAIKKDNVYRKVAIDSVTGLRTCYYGKQTEYRVYEFWPNNVLQLLQKAGIEPNTAPAFMPGCTFETNEKDTIKIASPSNNATYRITDKSKYLPFKAITVADSQHLFWFLDKKFLTETSTNEPYNWQMQTGTHRITVVSTSGDSATVLIRVKANSKT